MKTEPRIPPSHCPYCGKILDAASDPSGEGARPQPGDLTACLYCAQVLRFDANMVAVKPRPGELKRIYAIEPRIKERMELLTRIIRQLDRRDLGNRAERRRAKHRSNVPDDPKNQ